MPLYHITPQDLLMIRDSRPMEAGAGSGGHGGRWPEPSVLFDALHAALHRAFENPEPWEHPHRFGRSSDRDPSRTATQRFGSLSTAGPFPAQHGQWYFPCPQDVTRPGTFAPCMLPMAKDVETSNLPANPRLHPLGSVVPPKKESAEPWWNKAAIEHYLAGVSGSVLQAARVLRDDALFDREWAVGIAIKPETDTAADSQIYCAEYLRLRGDVTLGIHARMPIKNAASGPPQDCMSKLFPGPRAIVVGGQQRACHVEPAAGNLPSLLPVSPAFTGERIKWLLLTPAVFPAIADKDAQGRLKFDKAGRPILAHPGGWLPNWVDPKTGRVLLKNGDTTRAATESREDWRKRINDPARHPSFDCHLVAARIPKPIVVSGWSQRLHLAGDPYESDPNRKRKSARPTLLAVSAGAIYYFEGPDAAELAVALSWHGAARSGGAEVINRRSTLMGEKGFGLGVCGPWDFFD